MQRVRIMMDTAVTVSIYLPDAQAQERALGAMETAFAAMARVDSTMSSYREDSEVAAVNRAAALSPQHTTPASSPERASLRLPVSAEMASVLHLALQVGRASQGAFDITLAPVLQLWGFGTDSQHVPPEEQVRAHLRHVDFRRVRLLQSDRGGAAEPAGNNAVRAADWVQFDQPGMAIDLGGIAKGFAVDRGVAALRALGFADLMVEAGGDLRALASALTAGRRHVWIRHPREPDRMFARFAMDSGAVATSGDYERYFEQEGRRYHHILDPRTGHPAGGMADGRLTVSATVIAPTATLADAYSTAVFVMGPERGIALADSLPEIEAMVIYLQHGELAWHASRGLAGRMELVAPENAP